MGLVGALDRSILITRAGTGRVDGIAKFIKEGANLGVVIKFASLVHVNVFVGSILGRVAAEPGAEPSEWGSLSNTGGTIKGRSGMIGEKNVAGLATLRPR